MTQDCLHCKLMDAIDAWVEENEEGDARDILEVLAHCCGEIMSRADFGRHGPISGPLSYITFCISDSFARAEATKGGEGEDGASAPRGAVH
jgi:hypothetical protein